MILNGKAFSDILPPSARMSAEYVSVFFYNFILNVDKEMKYMTIRILYKKAGGEWKELIGSRGSSIGNQDRRGITC
jgi:hypothetical protein